MGEYSKEKKYYLQLNKDFFNQHFVKVIRAKPNGDKYILFLLQLMTESISHGGYLRFDENIPYDPESLAAVTGTDVDVVRTALKLFESIDLLRITEDKSLFITLVPPLIGMTTEGAQKKAEQRARKRTEQLNLLEEQGTPGGQMSTINNNQEIITNNSESRYLDVIDNNSIKIKLDINREKQHPAAYALTKLLVDCWYIDNQLTFDEISEYLIKLIDGEEEIDIIDLKIKINYFINQVCESVQRLDKNDKPIYIKRYNPETYPIEKSRSSYFYCSLEKALNNDNAMDDYFAGLEDLK